MPFLEIASIISNLSVPAYGFLGGFVGNIVKSTVDYLWTTDYYIRRVVLQNMIRREPIKIDSKYIIPNDRLIDRINSKISGNINGILVFAAPSGSGKSTFIKMAVKKLMISHPDIKVKLIENGSSALLARTLHELLKIPSKQPLSDYLPNNSVIIIDQIDSTFLPLSESIQSYIVELASDSCNHDNYKIILCISDPAFTKNILDFNGGEKIQPLCLYSDLIWTDNQLLEFIKIKLNFLTLDDKLKLIILAKTCNNSPGLIKIASDLIQPSVYSLISDDEWMLLEKYAEKRKSCWNEFLNDF